MRLALFLFRRLSTPLKVVVVGALLLLVLGIVSAIVAPPKQQPTERIANPYTVWRICRERVSAELKAPSTADFPSYSEQAISHSGALWTVNSYVDAQNSFGAKLRTRYTCTARFNPADATYDIESVSVN
jgi:hypothetical protein